MGRLVAVTAAHVFNECAGDMGTLFARTKDAEGRWTETPTPLPLRVAGKQMWVKNPTADVAAIYVTLPSELPIVVSTVLLADDAALTSPLYS